MAEQQVRSADRRTIHYILADCSLGRVLLAATEQGVVALYLGDADAPLEEALRQVHPGAEKANADSTHLSAWLEKVHDYLSGRNLSLDLPLDVTGTAFQQRVWQELQAIPIGRTRSYGEIARQVGRPTAARAVARACATNQVSLVIPCHRVVRETGQLGGYRWGLDRKRRLLDQEKAVGAGVVGFSPLAPAGGRGVGGEGG